MLFVFFITKNTMETKHIFSIFLVFEKQKIIITTVTQSTVKLLGLSSQILSIIFSFLKKIIILLVQIYNISIMQDTNS